MRYMNTQEPWQILACLMLVIPFLLGAKDGPFVNWMLGIVVRAAGT
jgi:hypothetical protein